MRWNLEDGSGEVLARNREWWQAESLAATPDGRFALTTFSDYTPPAESVLTLYDLEDGSSQAITSHGQWLSSLTLDPTGKLIVTGGMDGIVRVGPMTGEEPHLLLGHEGLINWLAVSPDGLWVASASFDGTIRLWPMPDMDQPPFHTLPYEELLAKLRALTNLRVVEDEDSATGYKLEVGPFPGWEEVPTW
jgi:WD40 repeat protein